MFTTDIWWSGMVIKTIVEINFLKNLAKPPNGLRYPRWGGRRDAVRLGKCWSVEKCLESRQNPQRRVHALLGAVELEDSLTEKDTAPFYLDKLGNSLTNFCTQLNFWQWPKTRFIKTPNNQEPPLIDQKQMSQKLADLFLSIRLRNTWLRIWLAL